MPAIINDVRTLRFFGGCLTLLALPLLAKAERLRPGEFFWEPELSPGGPLVIIISLPDQTLSAYRNGVRVAYSSISSGTKGRSTPAGVFTILEKEVIHFSNKYHHAPMPYMQRLTWQGVALHGGDLPGYPASHGCIRLPREFAKRLYTLTVRGTTVIVADKKDSGPMLVGQPGILLPSKAEDLSRPIEGEFKWNPERSEEGPITILASGADKTIYVYRNGVLIGRAPLQIYNSTQPLGSRVYTMLAGISETASAFVPGRPAHQWMIVKTDTTENASLRDLARRVHVAPDFAAKVYDLVTAGTTIVITDAPALPISSSHREVLLMKAEQK